MLLGHFKVRFGGLLSTSLLQDGCSLQGSTAQVGPVTLADLAYAGSRESGRAWQALVASLKRGGARIVARRRRAAMREIGRVRAQCGFDADPSLLEWHEPGRGPVEPPRQLASTAARPLGSPAVSARRSQAMRGFFPKLVSWYEGRAALAQMREVDSYLAQSTDLFDLERRIRDVERRNGSSCFWQ